MHRQALDKARLQFELAMLGKDITNSVSNNVQNGNVSSMATYQSRIVAAEAEINKWQKLVDEAQNAIDQLNTAQAECESEWRSRYQFGAGKGEYSTGNIGQ